MTAKKQVEVGAVSRQSAYIARNRASMIKAAQGVLAEVGLNATIDQLATGAQFSPTTIYSYFESKDNLLAEALGDVWRDWVLWAHDGVQPGSSFQIMIDVIRKFFRVKQSDPQFAKILKNTLVDPTFVINALKSLNMPDLVEATEKEGLVLNQFEERTYLWSYSLAGIMSGIYVTEELSPEKADAYLEISLQILDISKAKAKKLVSKPLLYPESKNL